MSTIIVIFLLGVVGFVINKLEAPPTTPMDQWTVDDVGTWINSIGEDYKQYSSAFKRNRINGMALLDMNETVLREMGVSSIPHQHRIMSSVKNRRLSNRLTCYIPCVIQNRSMDAKSALDELGLFLPQAAVPMDDEQTDIGKCNCTTNDDDLYSQLKTLQSRLEMYDMQEDHIKNESKNLKREAIRAAQEMKRIQSVPLEIGEFMEMINDEYAIVNVRGSPMYVRVLSTLDRELLKPNTSIAAHRYSHAVVDILPRDADSSVTKMEMTEKPDVTYADIGGMDIQKQEVKEAVELPLLFPELYAQVGIDPPRGVLMWGPPGTGKTMMAKAVAHQTNATFISLVASEFVQKWLGEGPRMVRDVFRLAREKAPSIIFIDEVDAIATKRFDSSGGADREVQRILLELLNQMDGFDQSVNVKVMMATNRHDTLDPALLRPGRLDRKIEFPVPDRRQKRLIFQVATAKMNLSDEIDLEDYIQRPDKLSAAEITAVAQEAGLFAVRDNRYVILNKDFAKAYKNNTKKADTEFDFYN